MFPQICKNLKKYCSARRMFKSVLGVWKCVKTLCLVFEVFSVTKFHAVY